MDITELLAFSHKQGASDMHLSSGLPPMIRVDGDIRRINVPALDSKEVYGLIYEIMNDKQRKEFEEFLECDFSFEIPGIARFRVNAYNQNRGAAGVFRTIPSKVLTMDDLGMGEIFRQIAQSTRGLITVTGPTGSGKSTTLAAMMDYVNANKYEHILTIEDPIEFVHESKKSLVNQREVHRDTLGFNAALRSALMAMAAAGLSVTAALILVQAKVAGAAWVEGAAMLPLATSGLVLGTGLFLLTRSLASPETLALPVTVLVNALMAPGGLVCSDQEYTVSNWEAQPLPEGVNPGRYYINRVRG